MRALVALGLGLRAVVMVVGVAVLVGMVLRARVRVMPERHALPGDDRGHSLNRNGQHQQRERTDARERSKH